MRFRTFIWWVIFVAALGWIGYTVASAGWTYYATQELVDRVLRESSGRHRNAFATGTQTALDALTTEVRNSIVVASRRELFPVQDEDVSVSANSAGISATVKWSYPVVSYGGRDVLVVPMSVQRSLVPSP